MLVNNAPSHRMPATRRWSSAWLLTSMNACVHPASTIRARLACSETASGVVYIAGSTSSPIRFSTVDSNPQR